MEVLKAKTISQIVCNEFEIKPDLEKHLTDSISKEKLQIIASSDPYLVDNQTLLLGFYAEIKRTWASSIVNRIKQQYKLNLRQKLDRCILAVAAAEEKIATMNNIADRSVAQLRQKPIDPLVIDSPTYPDTENSQQLKARVKELEQQLKATNNRLLETEDRLEETTTELEQNKTQLNKQVKLNIIVATDRLLPAGPPLNGVEKSPMLAIMGSPATFTQLEHNYRVLEAKWLGIVTKYHEWIKDLLLGDEAEKYWNKETIDFYCQRKTDAMERLNLIKSIYNLHKNNWNLLKPTIPISDEEYSKRMNAEIPNGWTAASFWD